MVISTIDKYSIIDEAMYESKQKPGMYNPVRLELIKPRSLAFKIRGESEKEQEIEKRETKKRDDPSPGSYDTMTSYDKTQGQKTFQLKISQSKFLKYTGKNR